MNELYENISKLSIDELENLITRAQELIQEKQQEAQRQAELEKQRLEQERFEAERKKQEEIAELQRRLKELQGDIESDGQSKVQEHTQVHMPQDTLEMFAGKKSEEQKNTTSKNQGYSMVSCPHCHELVPSGSKFCFYCGSDITQKKESKADAFSSASASARPEQTFTHCPGCGASVPSGSQFCQDCGKSVGNANQNTKPQQSAPKKISVYMGDAVKKWDMLAGEGEILGWKEVKAVEPEQKSFAHVKVTTKRILISVENRMQRGLRNSGGLLVYAATSGMEKGKPWIMIPLECIVNYKLSGDKEIRIEADKTYVFHAHGKAYSLNGPKAVKEIYSALQQVLPEKAI